MPTDDDIYYLIDMRDLSMLRNTLEPLMFKFLSRVIQSVA